MTDRIDPYDLNSVAKAKRKNNWKKKAEKAIETIEEIRGIASRSIHNGKSTSEIQTIFQLTEKHHKE